MTSSDTSLPSTAVVILNWNGEKLLAEFLPSVISNTSAADATIIVADNGSTDNSVMWLSQNYPDVKTILFDKNHGYAGGYNLVAEECKRRGYKYVMMLNSDVAPTQGWIAPLIDYMEHNPECGACQPKILSYRDRTKFEYAGASGGYIDRNGYPFCRGRIFDSIEHDHGQYDSIAEVFWASGAALMVRTSDYISAGGLDKAFFAHMEEIDLCWRMQLMGKKIAVVPQSVVYHLGGGSLDAKNARKTYLNFRNNLLMLHKNLPDSSRKSTLLRRRLLDTLAWSKYMVTLKFKHASAIFRAHRDFAKMRRLYASHPDCDLLHTTPPRPNIITDYYIKGIKKWH
ncbi:MAG: glycosyltransferase family 2 protein [Paramuribaculum sp.]|nr:glycosyltransferase family 2 protein [Paramuribaculum sp.]